MWHIMIAIIIIIAKPGLSTGRCQTDWTEYSGHCYYVSTGPVTWYNAQNYCGNKGSRLTSIGNEAEKDFIANITHTSDTDYWIGLMNTTSTPWRWPDGSALSYKYWNNGEPDGSGHCGRIAGNYKWRDTNCSSTHDSNNGHNIGYICKKDNSSRFTAGTPAESTLSAAKTTTTTIYMTSTELDSINTVTTIRARVTKPSNTVLDPPRSKTLPVLPLALGAAAVGILVIIVIVVVVCVRRRKKAADTAGGNDHTVPAEGSSSQPEELHSNTTVTTPDVVYATVNEVKYTPGDSMVEDSPANTSHDDVTETSYPNMADPADLYGKVNKVRTDPDELEIHDNQFYASFGE